MKKRKGKIILSVLVVLFIVLCNTYLVRDLIDLSFHPNYYRYSNYNGSFTAQNIQLGILTNSKHGIETRFKSFIEETDPPPEDRQLYRLFRRNPLYFWRWYSYFTDERYDLPYMNWKEIRARRGYDKKNSDTWENWQSF